MFYELNPVLAKQRRHRRKRVVLRNSTQPPTSQPPTSVVHQRRRGQPREIALHIGGKAAAQPTRRDANPICTEEDPEICFFNSQPCFRTSNSPLFGFCCF
ncbi:hypothetical protein SLEP1_g34539 [Rubroshorea leprosula]|uniref:Uncharacterized protein n=1 Tax=Rubroshorea leprosula TaxID=152421 RepID=A0AAV5KKL7_9ROSI|nr:hypothetical protein SLEP1_g34539 [Rubroshorea leprosula]